LIPNMEECAMRRALLVTALSVVWVFSSTVWAGFKPGNVFLADPAPEMCWEPTSDMIWEFDPDTGEFSLFTVLPKEACGRLNGLAFTPDGQRLQAAM